MVTIARSDDISGPWEKCPHNPILSHRSLQSPIQGIGHSDLVETPEGHWFMVCHGIRPLGYPYGHVLGRETCLVPVTWSENGWPIVGKPSSPGRLFLEMDGELPGSPPSLSQLSIKRDVSQLEVFTGPASNILGPQWMTLGHLAPQLAKFNSDGTAVTLTGTSKTLSGSIGASFIGRRQQHIESGVLVTLKFDPKTQLDEAGISIFANPLYHYDVFLTKRAESGRSIVVRRTVDDFVVGTTAVGVVAESVGLWVRLREESYLLGYVDEKGVEVELCKSKSRFLSTEVAGGFTGVIYGVYAQSSQEEIAEFKDFTYQFTEI
ncbi:hypothetical protein HK096_010016 [Nowakowskiella sp. JEL0078]|nr:hypothetical protein HK096_010016 [Nowakowskiella sp. JEL0078]